VKGDAIARIAPGALRRRLGGVAGLLELLTCCTSRLRTPCCRCLWLFLPRPSPILLSGTFFAPRSICSVAAFTFESSAARANPDVSSETGNTNTMTNASAVIEAPFSAGVERDWCNRLCHWPFHHAPSLVNVSGSAYWTLADPDCTRTPRARPLRRVGPTKAALHHSEVGRTMKRGFTRTGFGAERAKCNDANEMCSQRDGRSR